MKADESSGDASAAFATLAEMVLEATFMGMLLLAPWTHPLQCLGTSAIALVLLRVGRGFDTELALARRGTGALVLVLSRVKTHFAERRSAHLHGIPDSRHRADATAHHAG